MKRMPKHVPEIRISAAEHIRRESNVAHARLEYESHSDCGMSDVATDCEVLEASYYRKPKASTPKVEIEDDVFLTDIDASSDDEKETVIRYPIDCINNMLDLGMSCEEVSNSQGPSKKQKSITCSLEKSRPRMLMNDKFDDGSTDVEGMYMSEDDNEYKIDSDVDLAQFEPQAYVSVSDKIITGTIISPRATPEPGAAKKKRSSNLKAPVPISSVLTDTEMIISDTESNTTRSKKMTKVRPFKTIFDGFTTDTEDSDASIEHIPKTGTKQNKKITSSRSLDTFKTVSVIKNNMLAPIRKKGSDCEQSLTDTEHIYVDDCQKNESKHSRPSVIKVHQSIFHQSGLRQRQNVAKPKSNQTHSQVSKNQDKPKKPGCALNVPMQEDPGNATDIEAFGTDSDSQTEDVKPVAYLPNPRCEMVIDNESHKGKMSIIIPIANSNKNKSLIVEDLDCGFSDVEDLPGYEPEEYFRSPTPEVPRHTYMAESSLVENKETVIDKWKLAVENVRPEPVTDTEEIDLRPAKSQLRVRIPPRSRNVSECHTDVEDLEDDNENQKTSIGVEEVDPVVLTDVGEFSSEDSDDYIYRFTAVTPDLELNNTYTQARESMSPFSTDVKKRMNDSIPKIRTISPSPIPRNHTDTEDFLASQESAGSNWDYSDDCQVEPHLSVIHIKHTKKYNERAERDHIKGFVSRPDPTTDVEELTMMEALEVLAEKKRKQQQKTKELNEGTVKICYSGPKGQKIRGYKSSGKHDDSKGAGKSKEAVDSSWLSQREGESTGRGLGVTSPYDNIGRICYKEINDQTVYPPHLGYSEFESDVLGSNSSLAPGTDTFSELLFSSSNSESEEPDDNFLISKEQETCGILYDMSSHISKVPALLAKAQTVRRDSPDKPLELRLKYYRELCNRSLSPEIQGVSPAERAELQELEESISQMLIDIRREERIFYNDPEEEAISTIKRRPKRNSEDEKYLKINNEGETALKEIESHISQLLQDVEKEEREVMGSLRRDFKRSVEHSGKCTWEQFKTSSEKLNEDEDTWGDFKKSLEKLESTWDMINATDAEAAQVQYVPFRDSSYTPSPVESSSTSEDEYDIVPKVQLNIGNRMGKSTIDISVQNSPKHKTKIGAPRQSLNRSLPSLKSSSWSLWRDHNSTECLLEWQPPVWQTTSVEYIAPPDHIDPGSGYCIWSYPDEEPYGNEPKVKDETAPTTTTSIQSTAAIKITDEETLPITKSEIPISEKASASKKGSGKQITPQKIVEQTKKSIPKQKSPSPEKEVQKKKSPSPEKDIRTKKSTSPEKKKSLKDSLIARKSSESKISSEIKVHTPEKMEEKGKAYNGKKEDSKQQEVDEKITKKSVESPKGPSPEKKTGLLGKTLETIKKPFQEKSDIKAQKDKGKGKGNGKDKTTDPVKSNQEGRANAQTQEGKPECEEKPQQNELEQEPDGAQSDIKSLGTLLVEKIEAGSLASSETSEQKDTQPNIQGTEIAKHRDHESLLQKVDHESTSPMSQMSKGIEETGDNLNGSKEEAKDQQKRPVTVEHRKSEEKGELAIKEGKIDSKRIDAPSKDEGQSQITDTQKGKSNGKKKGKQNEQKPQVTAKAQEKTESGIKKEEVKEEVAIKLGEKNETPHEKKGKGKNKGKDKQGSPVETKTQKSGGTFVGKAVEAIKKPFQDQSKKSAGTKADKKNEGKVKQQQSIDSTKSSSEERDKETAESSRSLIEIEISSEIKESMESTTNNKEGVSGEDKAKQASAEQTAQTLQKAKSKSLVKEETKFQEKTKETSLEKTAQKPTGGPAQKAISNEGKDGSKSPTKEEKKKKEKGKNNQKSPPVSPISESGKDNKNGKQGKKQALEKQPTIEKAVELVTRTFIDQPDKHKAKETQISSVTVTSKTDKLIKELSEEESGQVIEGNPIGLVTKPFDRSKTDNHDTKTEKLIKELSIEKSGEIIEKGAIDLVAKPLQDFKSSSGTTKSKGVEKTHKEGFEHIQQTIDVAKSKLDQFKGIVTDETSRQISRGKDFAGIEKPGEHTLKREPLANLEQPNIDQIELSKAHALTETAAVEAVDSILREAQKTTDKEWHIKLSEEGDMKNTDETKASLGCLAPLWANDTLSKALHPEEITIPAVPSVELASSKDEVTTGAVEKSSLDKNVTVAKESIETESTPGDKTVVQKITAMPSEIVEDTNQVMQGFGKGIMGKLSGKKGKGKNKSEAPTQQTSVKESDTPQALRKTTNSTISGSTVLAKTVETTGKVTGAKTQDTKKDTTGSSEESEQGVGKEATGKIGGKKAKNKAKMKAATQSAIRTAGAVAVNIGTTAEAGGEKLLLASQNIQDSADSALDSLGTETIAVSKAFTKSVENAGPVMKETKEKALESIEMLDSSSKGMFEEVGDAFQGFKKDTMGRLSGKKAKGKQKLVASKQKLETAEAKTTSAIKAAAESTEDMAGSIGQKIADNTVAEIRPVSDQGKNTALTTVTKFTDDRAGITERTVETTFKPVERAVEKMIITTTELTEHVGDEARELGQGLHKKGEHTIKRSTDKVDKQSEQVITSVTKLVDEGVDITKKTVEAVFKPVEGAFQKTTITNREFTGPIEDVAQLGRQSSQEREHVVTEVSTKIGPELHAQTRSAVTFETLESNIEDQTYSAASSTDEIGRIIKEMESQLLKTKFAVDESATEESSEVESEDLSRECRTVPATPLLTRKGHSSDLDYNSDVDSTPVVTTPTLSRRATGMGGSQRLTPVERPMVRVITEYVGDQHESEAEDDVTYTVLEPEVRERRKFKIRFSPDMYESEEKDDADIVEVAELGESSGEARNDYKAEKKIKHMEKKFERMTSQTKEADPSMTETTNNEFQRIVSQLSLEDMDQALHQWDMGGLTPSEVDSKDLTLSSDEVTSPLQQEGSHTLEPGETGETPPIPSPRSPLRPTDSQDSQQETDKTIEKHDEDSRNYASRKMFWEQLSTGSTETPPTTIDVAPPVPKPRARSSISQSIDIPEEKKVERHLDASTAEASEIGKQHDLQGITTTDSVARGLTKERTFSVDGDTNSELEYLRTHNKEDVSYDNDAFDDDTPQHSPFPEPRQRKTIFERSVSLPGDSTIDSANSVRAKKKIFEEQIKKEMVVEQLISQMEEEGSPERKSFDTKDQEPADQEAMLNRQIHSEIVSHELEEQIESNLLENKALVEKKEDSVIVLNEIKEKIVTKPGENSFDLEGMTEIDSNYEPKITSTIEEVLHYKAEAITKPSDSLEVHVDKSELEDTEKVKEIEEELKVIEEKYEIQQQPADQAKVSSITSSQGESEDTFSESDVTPEDARFKEQQDIQVWGPSEKETKLGVNKTEEQRRQRSVHTPEEHIPDTVWEVPVQENLETVETETVGQFPSIKKRETRTEKEARDVAEIVVEEIDRTTVDRDETQHKEITKLSEKIEMTKKSEHILKLVRTDTTTSSMEITDEDLRSSGMTDNSPLESQVGILGTGERTGVFDDDSGDDVDAQELDKETIGKDVVDKTLAEVKQSLEAAKEELIEEKKKKRDSITKESPSEFEFKAMVLEKTFTESIQEHHQEETTILESKLHSKTTGMQESQFQQSEMLESSIKLESTSDSGIHEHFSHETADSIKKQGSEVSTENAVIIEKEGHKIDDKKDSSSVQSQVLTKDAKILLSTTGSEVSVDSSSSKDTVIEREVTKVEDAKLDLSKPLRDTDSVGEALAESEERKSPLEDVFSTSSSSDYKGGSNEASTLDKPSIAIRKHKKSSFKDPKSDGEMYSSSGSHYESFEQTSESIRTPGSRPLSSDIEGLVPNITGITTGSSEYESAISHEISGQSTTITSKEYQTAVSSLSSRDSMKSLDSESSGNLASIEVSSEASETLVPSAMELEKDSEDPVLKHSPVTPIRTEDQVKLQSFSESIEQSVSFDISEDISEDDDVQVPAEVAACMKRSHEMTFQPEPRPIVLEEESTQALNTSLDDMSSLVSSATDTGAMKTVRELSKTESERMDGSATSEQLSLTVSATSDVMSLSDSKEIEDTTVIPKAETIATQSIPTHQSAATVQSVTMTTTSVVEHGIPSVSTQVTSTVDARGTSHSNGPTQVDYNAEYDEGEHEVKKRGHRRNGSTSFRPSMIPVFHGRDNKKKPEEIVEDSAESDKYTQPLTVKEGTQEEKKDVDETEKLDEESFKTEADQAMNRDLREGRISIGECGAQSISMDSASFGSKSRIPSTAFSEADSEIAELLKQCSSDIPSDDPIERPKTPEPVEECELKDDTPEFSSEAQASVTELEMEYSGAFSRSVEYAAHVSPIMEKELSTQESWEHIGTEQVDEFIHSSDPLHLGFDDALSEKHELETQEIKSKDKHIDRSKSPVPDITVTHHHPPSCPTPQDSFEKIDMEPEPPKPDSSKTQESIKTSGKEAEKKQIDSDKDHTKEEDTASESPTSDSFELLEKPDLADEFVIIEEVGREASEQDTEGKSVRIDKKRVTPRPATSSAPPPIESPPPTITKMTQIKYFSSGATEEEIPFDFDSGSPAKSSKSEKESSQEGSPPSADEPEFKPELEASKKWMEMQFQGEPVAQIYGYDEYERGPLEDIKEEDINELEGSMNSKIGSMGSQVSQSIGSYGSVNSSTPDYDVLAGRKYFTRSGEHDDISMNSLQEFERLEHLLAMESGKHSKSLGSQDSLTSSSNSRKQGSRSGGDDISLASLKEFEGLESACIAAERIEKKAKEEETLLSEIEEGHESQASESESCVTISAMQRGESDEDDYERRMFEIDEIIRQAQTNVEQFMDSKSREMLDAGGKSETLGRADSLEEISKVPDLDLDQPIVSYSSGKSYIQQWEDLGDDLITSTDSLELKTQKSKTSVIDPFTTSSDSLEVKISQDVMSVSTDSIEAAQKAKKKDIMTDSIEIGERSSMITSVDSLEGKVTQANSIDDDELHATGIYDQSSSSGKEGDFSSSGKDDSAEGAVGLTNRMPPPRAEYLLGSTDSLEPTSSTATHATYQYETDSVMSSSFTSGDSTTMVDDNDEESAARASIWFDEGKPYVTEVIEPIIGDEEFSHVVHRKVEMPPEIHKVSFKGQEAEAALRDYIEKFDPGEDCTETREVDEHGNVHVKRVIQKRVILRPDVLGGNTTDLSGPKLEKYLQTLTQSQLETEPPLETIHTESHSTVTTLRTTTTLNQGETIKTEQEQKETVEPTRRGSRPPLKYDISVDEEPEYDPREHDWRFNLPTHLEREEETQDGAAGYTQSRTKGSKEEKSSKK